MQRGLRKLAVPKKPNRGVACHRASSWRGGKISSNLPDVIFLVDEGVLRYHVGQLRVEGDAGDEDRVEVKDRRREVCTASLFQKERKASAPQLALAQSRFSVFILIT